MYSSSKRLVPGLVVVCMLTVTSRVMYAYDWQDQPEKAAIMLVHAHPDDEGIYFGGAITYYSVCRQLPMVVICMTNWDVPHRVEELKCAIWTYGLRNPPIFAPFADSCLGQDLQCCWDHWGGKDNAVRYLTEQVRRYKPDVILCMDFNGEYGHPNHMGAGIAAADSFFAAPDPQRYPEQLSTLDTWQPKKCYVHLHSTNPVWHDWDITCDALNGLNTREVTDQGLACHVSQGEKHVNLGPWDARQWGLYGTVVGLDTYDSDFMQNIDTSIYYEGVPTNLQAVMVNQQVALSWQDNAESESGYVVQRKPYGGQDGWHDIVSLGPDSTSHTDTSTLHGMVTYMYRVGVVPGW